MKSRMNQGITLIALVITIIVLLILAGVTIAMLTGENGILNQANEAKAKTEQATIQEQIELTKLEASMNKEEQTFLDINNQKAIIPPGFAVSLVKEENEIDNGLVIMDEIGNEFVWIPVDDPNEMYGTLSNGTKMGKLYEFIDGEATPLNWKEINGVMTIIDNTYREPDIATYDNNTIYNDGLFTKESLQKEFDSMIESVIKNRGFYIGRYEMSLASNKKIQSKKEEMSSNAGQTDTKMWYGLYAKAKTYENARKATVKSSMIWGCQWDAMMKWMEQKGIDVTASQPQKGIYRNKTRITGS